MAARMNGRTESRRSCIVCRAHVIKLLKRRSRTRGSSNELRQRVVELRERLIESCKWIIELSTRVIAPSERFIEHSDYQLMRRFRDVNTPDAHASRFGTTYGRWFARGRAASATVSVALTT